MTITANNQTKVYGAAVPTLTASFTGFVNGDTSASLTTQPVLSTTASVSSNVSGNPYTITASGAIDSDYSISYAAGMLTITPAALTITAANQSKVYGAALPTLTALYSGFVAGDTSASLTTQPTLNDDGHRQQRRRHLLHYRQRRGRFRLQHLLCEWYADRHDRGSNDHGRQSDQGLRRSRSDADRVVLGLRQWRHLGEPDDSAPLTTTATTASHVAGSPYTITAAGAADANYAITYVAGSLNVTAAPLTINADNQTKAYGAALPALTASYTGFVNGDSSASLTTQPTLTTTATAASSTDGGPYAITASGAVDPDYTISYVSGSLSVTPVALTITADNQTMIYGAGLPTLTASYTGFVNGDTPANLHVQPTVSTTAISASGVGTYGITASGALDPDYTISYVGGTLNVTPANLNVVADNLTRPEGQANPTLTYTISGFVNGDTISVVSGEPNLSTTATIVSPSGQYTIAVALNSLVATNYNFTTTDGVLTVTNTPITTIVVTVSPGSTSVYGQALVFSADVSAFSSGDPVPTGTVQFEVDGVPVGLAVTLVNGVATSDSVGSPHAGAHTIQAIYSGDSFYTTNTQAVVQTVTPAPLTITADNQSKVYGAAVPTLTASFSGFVNGDTSASLTTQPTISTTASVNSKVAGNPYTITASGAADVDYAISYVSATLTVTPAALTITADNQTKLYGAALPTLTVSYSGFVNDDNANNLSTQPTVTTTATTSSHVGLYSISANGAIDSDYTISYVDGSLTITPAPLTITAENQTNVYGATLPALTASYTGFVNGDTSASLTMPATLSTSATAASHVADSPYPITASGAEDADYSITYVAGSFTVTAAPLTITADNQTNPYGSPLPALTASYEGFVNGDTSANLTAQPTLTTTATAGSPVASNPYEITATAAVDSDYSISYVSGTLNVTPVALTITADNQTKVYGAGLPTLTASYNGFVNGDTPASLDASPTLSTAATASSDAGLYAITASGAVDTNYTISYAGATLTVTAASLTITADNQTKIYARNRRR